MTEDIAQKIAVWCADNGFLDGYSYMPGEAPTHVVSTTALFDFMRDSFGISEGAIGRAFNSRQSELEAKRGN